MKIEVKEEVVSAVESVSVDAGSLCLTLHNKRKGDYERLVNSFSSDGCGDTLTIEFHSKDFGLVQVSFDSRSVEQTDNIRNLSLELSKLYKGVD